MRKSCATAAGGVLAAILMTGCTTESASGPPTSAPSMPTAVSSPATPSQTASADDACVAFQTRSQQVSRGQKAAQIPSWAHQNPQRLVAAQYVIAGQALDARLDTGDLSSWPRQRPYETDEQYRANCTVHEPQGGSEIWAGLRTHDGWVEPVIGNILGDEPQAVGERPVTDPRQLTVIWTLKYHRSDKATIHDQELHQATVTLTGGSRPKVSGVTELS